MSFIIENGNLEITYTQITQQEFENICRNNKFTKLYCFNCPLLTSLPDMPKLTILYCYDCPLLNKCIKDLDSYKKVMKNHKIIINLLIINILPYDLTRMTKSFLI